VLDYSAENKIIPTNAWIYYTDVRPHKHKLGEEGKMYRFKFIRPGMLLKCFLYLVVLPPLLAAIIDGLNKLSKGSIWFLAFPFYIVFWVWLILPAIVFTGLFKSSDSGFCVPCPVDWRGWVAALMLYSVIAVGLWLLCGGRIKRKKTP